MKSAEPADSSDKEWSRVWNGVWDSLGSAAGRGGVVYTTDGPSS